jgi:hypothetical protein
MPAYSRLVADYATPFPAQTWQPENFSAGRGFRGGSVAVGMDLDRISGRSSGRTSRRKPGRVYSGFRHQGAGGCLLGLENSVATPAACWRSS